MFSWITNKSLFLIISDVFKFLFIYNSKTEELFIYNYKSFVEKSYENRMLSNDVILRTEHSKFMGQPASIFQWVECKFLIDHLGSLTPNIFTGTIPIKPQQCFQNPEQNLS